jgi:Protein of unknown function (DUF3632)
MTLAKSIERLNHANSTEEDKALAEWLLENQVNCLDKAAAEGDDNTLNVTIESFLWSLGQWSMKAASPHSHDVDCHLFSATVIQAGKSYHYNNPKQTEIVYYVLNGREIGTMARPIVSPSGEQTFIPATTSTGARTWTDLPFFVEDIEEDWMTNSPTLDSVSRANFIAFIGRLVSVGISERLALCALRLFHDALETPRRLRASDAGQDVPILDLLKAIGAWLITHRWKTYTLSSRGVQFDTALANPGELARSAGVTVNGFSIERRLFWISRLREIRSQLSVDEMKELEIDNALERLSDDSVKVFIG